MIPVIAIFDIGKTNKKFFLINEQYQIVHEQSAQVPETVDEDGFPCDDLLLVTNWVKATVASIINNKAFDIKAFNFSAYGASLVYIDAEGKPVTPLYNYLKPYPPLLSETFYNAYGKTENISLTTASPVLGNLNSGMQLYRLSHQNSRSFQKIHYALHLPQYISYLVTGKPVSEITSIGCHTGLWDFTKNDYHPWVKTEQLVEKFPPLFPSNEVLDINIAGRNIKSGIGLHDSSSALIPYRTCFKEPFILLSTGTWCISLNPFNNEPLTIQELRQDCLCYLGHDGSTVKASRLFAGHEHEQQVKLLAAHFKVPLEYYHQVGYNPAIDTFPVKDTDNDDEAFRHASAFAERSLSDFNSYEQAYHQLIKDIIHQQHKATMLVVSGQNNKRIFVDGGFARNTVYMHLLAQAFPEMEVYAASVSQATAIGAALAIHSHWNEQNIPGDMVRLKFYAAASHHF